MDPKSKAGATPEKADTTNAHGPNWHKEQPHPEHVLGTDRPDEIPDLDEAGSGSMPAGNQTGQTARGSYATDQSTGAGAYVDHTGTFSSEPVAQPGNDKDLEPEERDPQL